MISTQVIVSGCRWLIPVMMQVDTIRYSYGMFQYTGVQQLAEEH